GGPDVQIGVWNLMNEIVSAASYGRRFSFEGGFHAKNQGIHSDRVAGGDFYSGVADRVSVAGAERRTEEGDDVENVARGTRQRSDAGFGSRREDSAGVAADGAGDGV